MQVAVLFSDERMQARIPRYLHLPLTILWFDVEDISLIASMYMLWLMIDHWMGLVLMIALPWWVKRLKESKPRGYLRHILYRYGFMKLSHYPSPMTKHYKE